MRRIALIASQVAMIVLVVVATETDTRAEGFVDLRVGGSFTEDNDVDVSAVGTSGSFETEYEDSVTGGVRAGYWFDSVPWIGLAGDVTYFGPDDDTGGPEIDVIPISPLLMLRAPLADSEEFPNGRIQPFAGVGPGIFISLHDFGPDEDESVDVGLDVHAGLRFLITRNVAIFAQYRYTWFEPEVELDVGPFDIDVEPELSTHHAAAGIGFHF